MNMIPDTNPEQPVHGSQIFNTKIPGQDFCEKELIVRYI